MSAALKLQLEVKLTPAQVAEAFCNLNDEEQAQVFIEAARIAASWSGAGFVGATYQWMLVGKHLAKCGCSSGEARALVLDIAEGIRS